MHGYSRPISQLKNDLPRDSFQDSLSSSINHSILDSEEVAGRSFKNSIAIAGQQTFEPGRLAFQILASLYCEFRSLHLWLVPAQFLPLELLPG